MRLGNSAAGSTQQRFSDASAWRGMDAVVAGNQSFIGGDLIWPGAGLFAGVQYFNPAGSGVNAVFDRLWLSTTASVTYLFGQYDTLLTTLSTRVFNRNIGGLAPKVECRTQSLASAVASLNFRSNIGNAEVHDLVGGYPIILPPGTGVLANMTTAAQGLALAASWREIAIT